MTTQSHTHVTLPPDYLRVADLDESGFAYLLGLAAEMKADPGGWVDSQRGKTVAMYFEKPSTRTRVSFAAAATRLGMQPLGLRPDELQLGRGEPIADTARVLSSYCAAIVIRTFAQSVVEETAAAARVPVINALTDDHHPCQALADMLTLREHFGRLRGLKLAYVGDSDNVARSLVEAGALAGVEIAIASPHAFEPNARAMRAMSEFTAEHHGHVTVVEDPREAVAGADAVYTDVWVSMGAEADADRRLAVFEPYRVTEQLMAAASPDAVFMHCLPAHRGQEVEATVIDGPRSIVFAQAENRLCTEQAVLAALIDRAERS